MDELKYEAQQKPDWKQWIPVYGIYKIGAAAVNSKPNIAGIEDSEINWLIFHGTAVYHAVTTVAVISPIVLGLESLLK